MFGIPTLYLPEGQRYLKLLGQKYNKDMIWEELVEKVKDLPNIKADSYQIDFYINPYLEIGFYKKGYIDIFVSENSIDIAENRTPYQMYQIIKALTETKE